jgi:GDPmannose 4,6-dehydratase
MLKTSLPSLNNMPIDEKIGRKKVLITGITGQDGSYMAEYCLNLGHQVFGMVRRTAQIHDQNFRHLYGNKDFKRVYGDLLDSPSIEDLVREIQPDYFINFAAQSFVGVSWKIPEETFMAGAVGVLKCLEAVRKFHPKCRFYNAGTSEQFGDVIYSPQDEKHPFRPRSPYGAAKCAASHLVKVYRESYGLYAIQGILFNHESERRGEEFVTRKITKGVARIYHALKNDLPFEPIQLGNLQTKRDWSHAEDFIDGVWKMLNQPILIKTDGVEHELGTHCGSIGHLLPSWQPKEYVLSSGSTHTIAEFVRMAFETSPIGPLLNNKLGVGTFHWYGDNSTYGEADKDPNASYYWSKLTEMGEGMNYRLVEVNKEFFRPAEVELLLGDSALAQKELGWKPKISLDILAKRMVESDINELATRPQLGHPCNCRT